MSADKKYVSKDNLAAFAEALAARVPLKSDIPTKVSDLQNDLGFTDKPGTITSITLNGTTTSSGGVNLGYLVAQESGKGLSSNDYTTLEKNKLAGIESGAEVNTIESISVNGTTVQPSEREVSITIPTNVSDLTNDAGYLTSFTETDPVFSASAAAGITTSDITNWNNKTSNTGTLTGVSFNGTSATVTNGVAAITASIPSKLSDLTDDVVSGNYLPIFSSTNQSVAGNCTGLNRGSTSIIANLDGEFDPEIKITGNSDSTYISTDRIQLRSNSFTFGSGYTYTTSYGYSGIEYKPSGGSLYTLLFPSASGTLALTSDIPSSVTESTVSGWGFTKNEGTVVGSGLTADKLVLGNGTTNIKTSTYGVSTSAPTSGSDNTTIPTSAAVFSAIDAALTSVLTYRGTIGSSGATVSALPASHDVGDVYVVSVAGTYAGKACEVGDYIICNTAGSSASDAHWNVVTGENQVDNKSASLAAAGSSATIATVDGTNLTITTPSSWTGVDKTGTLTGVSFNNTAATVSNGVAAINASIPDESTVSGWGFTKNAGTITGITMNGASKGTSGVVNLGTVVTSETDPVFSASAAAGITSADITNWNGKTSNTGTITGITMNGASKGTSGVVNLGTVITSETQLSKGTTTGAGNAVTDISVSNHQITLTKGATFLTEHQSIKTINNQTITGTGNVSLATLPTVTSSDNGKILQVVNGAWALVSPISIYSGSESPSNSIGNDGDIYIQS